MRIQTVTFNLKDLSDADYRTACVGWAPILAAVPGLISKIWLADETTNTYGGVYTWLDRTSMRRFATSDFFKAFAGSPNFVNITARDFDVLDEPSLVTRTRVATAA